MPSLEQNKLFMKYMAAREEADRHLARKKWNALTPREQGLVKDAAVFAYFLGTINQERDQLPPDSAILDSLFMGVESYRDLYPTLARLGEETTGDENDC
jgi:hypothetical protein